MSIFDPEDEHWINRRSGEKDQDYRESWEHDYGRVVHSAAFRRLQAKTQVFGVGENDFYRTRLTHSLEVSQIGESLRNKLYREPIFCGTPKDKEKEEVNKWPPNSALIRTICLAHDLGHPPFGHGGEVALNRCMLGQGGFEGNGQALRIVTRLENYSKRYGMDLTRRSVLGLIKYPVHFRQLYNYNLYPDNTKNLATKPIFKANDFKPPKCYHNEEYEIVNDWVSIELNDWTIVTGEFKPTSNEEHKETTHKSLDASIMEVADDIAYGIHDLEDCIALGKIKIQDFQERLPESLRTYLIRYYSDDPVVDLFGVSYVRKKLIGAMVNFFINATRINIVSKFEHPLFKYRVKLTCAAQDDLKKLKDIVKELVINKPEVQHLEFKGQKIVTELFHAFKTDPKRLLQNNDYMRIDNHEEKVERVICDYIAGMTDEYAITRYQSLFEPRSGSIFDRL